MDLTHDASDDGFHEIQLNGKQLVFLFMATTVVSVVIFLCGVLVGRGVRAQQLLGEEPATNPPLAAAAPAPTDTVAEAGPAAAEPPTPPAESSDPAPGASPPPQPQPDKPVETPAPATAKPAEEPKRATPPPVAAPEPVSTPAPSATSGPAPAPSPARPTRGPQGSSADKWVVQIVALRDRSMASSIVERLSGKGYPAFVVNPSAGTPAPVFKVQVGRYADREQAEQIARRLEKEEQFKPWVSR